MCVSHECVADGADRTRTATAVPAIAEHRAGWCGRCSTTHRRTGIPESTIARPRKSLFWNVIRLLPWYPSSKPPTSGERPDHERAAHSRAADAPARRRMPDRRIRPPRDHAERRSPRSRPEQPLARPFRIRQGSFPGASQEWPLFRAHLYSLYLHEELRRSPARESILPGIVIPFSPVAQRKERRPPTAQAGGPTPPTGTHNGIALPRSPIGRGAGLRHRRLRVRLSPREPARYQRVLRS